MHFIAEMAERDPEEARRFLKRAMRDAGYSLKVVRARFDLKKAYFERILTKLGMHDYASRARARLESSFRLPPLPGRAA